jgi:putative transposase
MTLMNRALILVAGWIGRGMTAWLSRARRPLAVEVAALRERLERIQAENDLLRSRLVRIEPHARPHYRPWERLSILLHRARYGLSMEAVARAFVITSETVRTWLREAESGVVRLVRARQPMNALPDLVGEVTVFLKRQWPRWGTRRIAGILARLGIKASRTSVQRLLCHPSPRRPASGRRGQAKPILPSRPGQVWVIDFTKVGGFFRRIAVAVVLDAFSRKILALRISAGETDAALTCRLVREAMTRYGNPRWVVTDRGLQFRARAFKAPLRRRRIGRRYAALGDANLARMDRLWRTMKEEFARGLLLYLPLKTIERQLRAWSRWHNSERPHSSLGCRTPDEVHEGRRLPRPRHDVAGALEVRFVDGEKNLPVFRLRSAA